MSQPTNNLKTYCIVILLYAALSLPGYHQLFVHSCIFVLYFWISYFIHRPFLKTNNFTFTSFLKPHGFTVHLGERLISNKNHIKSSFIIDSKSPRSQLEASSVLNAANRQKGSSEFERVRPSYLLNKIDRVLTFFPLDKALRDDLKMFRSLLRKPLVDKNGQPCKLTKEEQLFMQKLILMQTMYMQLYFSTTPQPILTSITTTSPSTTSRQMTTKGVPSTMPHKERKKEKTETNRFNWLNRLGWDYLMIICLQKLIEFSSLIKIQLVTTQQ